MHLFKHTGLICDFKFVSVLSYRCLDWKVDAYRFVEEVYTEIKHFVYTINIILNNEVFCDMLDNNYSNSSLR